MPLESTSDSEGTAFMSMDLNAARTSESSGTALLPWERNLTLRSSIVSSPLFETVASIRTARMPFGSRSEPATPVPAISWALFDAFSEALEVLLFDADGSVAGFGSGISKARCRSSPSRLTDSPVELIFRDASADPSKVVDGVWNASICASEVVLDA